MGPVVGVIANPVSARDIRRVIANAASLQIADRANIVLRVLAALAACGVRNVVMMPEHGGIRGHVMRGIERSRNQGESRFPQVNHLDMPVTGTAEDSAGAARLMRRAGVAAIVVLGGDGTHRAVVKECGQTPIAGISTGTNNAFPEHREPTITGLAAGLAATGRIPLKLAFTANKRLDVHVGDRPAEIALVDVAFVTDGYIGARALWRTETFRELFVTFADPEVIGMAAIAGLIEPVARGEEGGMMVSLAPAATARSVLQAPIAPGLIAPIGIDDWRRMPAGIAFHPRLKAGAVALDGEREIFFDARDAVSVTLTADAFRTVNVPAVMHYAATAGLLRGGAPLFATAYA
ncbi:ATP-NAD kinase family protein [Bradyrhizobium sp. WD16]|uniref:ATP-NAD kinase family protein n=1 Tax=Bradyrhizobium sp. WD16 TaxID=1521768 RepID=UPI0020A40A7D|nr:NAD(+)/NADH kinase [Bradyrhizobium sp. WD16]UTD25692.1 acetoin catabolism protein X [Bradyrhizobium sp. WD16]